MNPFNIINSCLIACLSLACVTGCSKQTAEKSTVQSTIQGRWVGFEKDASEKLTLEFSGNQFTYWDSKTNEIGGGTFVINDTAQPKQMDLTFERIDPAELRGKVAPAIFELNGDSLTFAGAEPGSTQRPTSIAGGDRVRVFTFKRE
jgi:uncharacterized protein (TIGR03067 family)